MRSCLLLVFLLHLSLASQAEDNISRIRKAAERSILAQPGTHPFHLKAVLAPSFEREKDSNRTGTIEIWWLSPTQWKREMIAPSFHLTEILDGSHHWQHTDGNYFPEWLREITLALIQPLPVLDETLIANAETRSILGETHFSWMEFSGNGNTQKAMGAGLALDNGASLIRIASGHASTDSILDPQSRGIWLDANGLPIRSHFRGLDFINSEFRGFDGVQVARQVNIFTKSKLALQIHVTQIESPADLSTKVFTLSGHDWKREFTDESR